MGYSFEGMFATGDEVAMTDLLLHQPGLGRMISVPFVGFGVSFENEYGETLGDFGGADPEAPSSRSLIEWSRRFPSLHCAFVQVECFGGLCDYGGFAFADGAVLHAEPLCGGPPGRAGLDTLQRVLAAAGVSLGGSGHFEPLTRGFFGEWPVPPIAAPQPQRPPLPWWRRLLPGSRGSR